MNPLVTLEWKKFTKEKKKKNDDEDDKWSIYFYFKQASISTFYIKIEPFFQTIVDNIYLLSLT